VNTQQGESLLVRFGIDSYLGRMVVRVLVWLLLFQPVYVAMGMELEDSSKPVDTPAETLEETLPLSNEGSQTERSDEEVVETEVDATDLSKENTVFEEAVVENNEETENDISEETSADESESEGVVDEPQDDVGEEVSTDEFSETNEDEQDTIVPADTGGGSENSTPEEIEESEEVERDPTVSDADVSTSEESTENEGGERDAENIASSTLEIASSTEEKGYVEEVTIAKNADNKYIFSEGDCTLVSEGEFYCVAEGPETQVSADPRVYAEKDREGDREIYYFDGIEVHRITNNSYDDFAPVFDDETLRIVWQAMVQDRLQVMIHEVTQNTTRQITSSRQNSSNPSIVGDTVVWQEWVDTNWEIMMTKVSGTGQAFEIERLTDNAVHDMFPVVYDDLITWQSERGSSWEVVVYDMRTEKRHTLEKNEDTKYENPRFVLLFDSKHDNGDVETIGYNLETGEMMELGTKSKPQPVVPVSPKEETPDALPRESASSTQIKVSGRDDDVPDNTL
jgi:beta propeller repeat protein